VYPGPLRLVFSVPGFTVDEPLGPDDPDPVEAAREAGVGGAELRALAAAQSRVVTVRATVSASLTAARGEAITAGRPLVLASPSDAMLLDLWRRGRMLGMKAPAGAEEEGVVGAEGGGASGGGGATPRLAPASDEASLMARVAVPGSAAAETGRVVGLYDADRTEAARWEAAQQRTGAPSTARGSLPRPEGAARGAPAAAGFESEASGVGRGTVPPVFSSSWGSGASVVLRGLAGELAAADEEAAAAASAAAEGDEEDEGDEEGWGGGEDGGAGREAGRAVVRANIPAPAPPATVFVRAVAETRDGRRSAVASLRYALLTPLQHFFRCVLPPGLARLEGRLAAVVGSPSLDAALAMHPHALRRGLRGMGVRKADRDAIVAGLRPLRDAVTGGQGLRPFLEAVTAEELQQQRREDEAAEA